MSEQLAQAIVQLERDLALEIVRTEAERGKPALEILETCQRGMAIVGERFQQGDYYLAELLLSGEILKEATALLQPCLASQQRPARLGTVILATLQGDLHDLGKNIVGFLLQSHGFEVHDLGVDVPPEAVLEKVREVKPDFVGFSALITPTFRRMKEATELLEETGLRPHFKLLLGGGVTTPAVGDYIGADFQTRDAMAGVSFCRQNVRGEGQDHGRR